MIDAFLHHYGWVWLIIGVILGLVGQFIIVIVLEDS